VSIKSLTIAGDMASPKEEYTFIKIIFPDRSLFASGWGESEPLMSRQQLGLIEHLKYF
jgi:hypothetical protein